MQRALLAVVFTLLVVTTLPAATRKWTSSDGQFSTEAELVDFDDTSATLKKRSGDTVTVPLERLSEADRRFLRAQKKKPAATKEIAVSYSKDVQPFLAHYCAECHNQAKAKEGYDVTSYATLTRPGKTGTLVVPGKPDISRLIEVLQGMSKSMPPMKAAQPEKEEIAKLVAWIEGGAKDDAAMQSPAGKRSSGLRRSSRKTL